MKMEKMNVWLAAGLLAAVLAAPSLAAEQMDHSKMGHDKKGKMDHSKMDHGSHGKKMKGKQGKTVTLKGEVIDMSCYLGHEAKGKKHKGCAKSCILDKGLPMGLLTKSGKVYLLTENHAKAKAYKQVKELAAKKVSIRGKKYSRGGVQAIAVSKVTVLK